MEIESEVLDCMNDIIKKVVKKERRRLYDLKNKEKIKESQRLYRLKNKEKRNEYDRLYHQKNKEKIRLNSLTDNGIKSRRIRNWKFNGLICEDIDELYNTYCKTSFCDYCKVEFSKDKIRTSTTKCMDHDHSTGLFRNILCHSCNVKRG
tara:strand:- start:153 stop:599 length:447 start_codon:yes stop_codon:yes gene_type:complete